MRLREALLIGALAVLLALPAATAPARAADAGPGSDPTSLYLSSGNTLTPGTPAEGSAAFPAQAKTSIALVWLVGTWNTAPLAAPLHYSGNIDFSVWAKGSGAIQVTTHFQVYFATNGQRGATAYATDSQRLSSTAKELKGTAAGVTLTANAGDTLTMMIYVSEKGGGGSVVFGGSTPSRMELTLAPLNLSVEASEKPGELHVFGSVSDIWGATDVDSLTIGIMGPFSRADTAASGQGMLANRTKLVKTVSLEQLTTDESVSTINFTYNWKYDPSKTGAGEYMVVAEARTLSNSTLDASTWLALHPSGGGFSLGGTTGIVAGVLVAAAVAGVALVFLYRRKRAAAGSLMADRRAVAAVGASLLIVVVSLSLYLVLAPASSQSEKAPGFNLQDVNGKAVSLDQYKGSVVVLDMMATWCPTCNQEIPELKAFHSAHPEAVIISIDVDRTESSAKLKEHMQSKGATWTACMDTDSMLEKYQANEIPKIVVINPSGYVTFMKAGLVKSDELASESQKAGSGSAPILALGGETGFAALAFLAGISAFFSPCAFPLLPGYMTYYLGRDSKEEADRKATIRKAVIGGIVAAAGVLIVYALMGLLVAGAGEAVKSSARYLAPVVAVVILVMGLVMLTKYDIPLYRVTAALKPLTDRVARSLGRLAGRSGGEPGQYAGLLGYGAGYGAASLGCHAPIFIAVVMAGLVAGGVGSALLAFVMYALGMGLFLVIVTVLVGMAKTSLVKRMTQWMPMIKKISGVVLIIVGIVLIYSFYLSVK